MAQLRDLIENAEDVWEVKDEVRNASILDENPIHLNKHRFKTWMAERVKELTLQMLEDGVPPNEISAAIDKAILPVITSWRVYAKRLNMSQRKHDRMVKRHAEYKPLVDPAKGEG